MAASCDNNGDATAPGPSTLSPRRSLPGTGPILPSRSLEDASTSVAAFARPAGGLPDAESLATPSASSTHGSEDAQQIEDNLSHLLGGEDNDSLFGDEPLTGPGREEREEWETFDQALEEAINGYDGRSELREEPEGWDVLRQEVEGASDGNNRSSQAEENSQQEAAPSRPLISLSPVPSLPHENYAAGPSTALDVPREPAPSAGRKQKGKRKANAEEPSQQSGRAKRPRLMPDPARLATAKQELSMRAAREHIRNESKASGHRAWAATTTKWEQMERQASVRVTSAVDGGILPSSSSAAGPSRAPPLQPSASLEPGTARSGVRDGSWERGEVEDTVRELFNEKPEWTRAEIEARIGEKRPGDKTMREIIRTFADARGKFWIRKRGWR
ncbi:hypothetical protein K488DRAFT_69877 [Vararia minispora EC-137]|uniref:Uncharacterized protein n=1 Tax=Vararia minispora EC-137 TaxID=1314806 RepID=A0ACB8QNX3_9AGAM|nr:hypothetical protein K488DRAFT_69877 [Vararia minispora EC-137]